MACITHTDLFENTPLISTDCLEKALQSYSDLYPIRIIDASWRLPGAKPTSAAQDYAERHIEGAHFFDIDTVADRDSSLPHMVPSPELFARTMQYFGIRNEDIIIIYDDVGLFSAPRVWWTFRAMGHDNVLVLDGGFKKWRAEKRPVTSAVTSFPTSSYRSQAHEEYYCDHYTVRNALTPLTVHQNPQGFTKALIADARPTARFEGHVPEPRPELRRGHIPGSVNMPFGELLSEDGTLLPPNVLQERLAERGLDKPDPVIATCGSGITACLIALARARLGLQSTTVYDGSWAEWGRPDNNTELFPVSPATDNPTGH